MNKSDPSNNKLIRFGNNDISLAGNKLIERGLNLIGNLEKDVINHELVTSEVQSHRIMISVHSDKRGSGSSIITANLAAQVALTGKRVAIVDTDVQSPGIHAFFGLDGEKMGKTLNDFLYGRCEIGEAALSIGDNVIAAPGRSKLAGAKLWLIPSSISGREFIEILRDGYDFGLLHDGLQTLLEVLDLDYLFIDTHSGYKEETLFSLAISDVQVLLLRPDQQILGTAHVTIDVVRKISAPNLLLAINQLPSQYNPLPLAVKNDIEEAFDAPVAGVMPFSEDILINGSADLFSLKEPNHPWSKALRNISDMVLAHQP
jgi:MinD-like ATPase involved in chromosome partitioning or flagellar assembly